MSTIKQLFKTLTLVGEVVLVQNGFLYEARVDTRKTKLIFKDFIILARALLKNKYLEIRFEVEGNENALKIIEDLKKIGISIKVLRNQQSWLSIDDKREVDLLMTLNLPLEEVDKLVKNFYVVVDAALVYPTGYISWDEYFKKDKNLVHSQSPSVKNTPKNRPQFDYKECYYCGYDIYVLGSKFCSDYCKDMYPKKLKERFG